MGKHKYYVTTQTCDARFPLNLDSIYESILGDAIARHRRMSGFDVGYLTSSRRKPEPPEIMYRGTRAFTPMVRLLDVHPTHGIDLASTDHTRAVHAVLRQIMASPQRLIYQATYEGRYCFYDEIDISEGSKATVCPICGRAGTAISESRYFFRASAYEGRLRAVYKYRPEFLQPLIRSLRNERLIENGVKDIAISTRYPASGVPWPDAPGQGVSSLVCDLVGYLSGLGFGKEGHGSDDFRKFWPANLQVINKLSSVSHGIYWPALLMAADLPLPRHIFSHSIVSSDVAEDTMLLAEQFVRKFGTDGLRYSLLREVPYDKDINISFKKLADCYEKDVLGALDGLAQRIVELVKENCNARIPAPTGLGVFDSKIESMTSDVRAEARFLFDHNNFSEGIKVVGSLIPMIDKLLTNAVSESVEKRSRSESDQMVHDACQSLAGITLLIHPVLPRASAAIWKGLGQNTAIEDQLIDEAPWGSLIPGTPVSQISFPPPDSLGTDIWSQDDVSISGQPTASFQNSTD